MNTIRAFFIQNQGNFFDFKKRAGEASPPPPRLVARLLNSWLIIAALLWRLVNVLPRAVFIVVRGGVRGAVWKCSYNTFKLLSRLVVLYRISCCPWYSNVLFFCLFSYFNSVSRITNTFADFCQKISNCNSDIKMSFLTNMRCVLSSTKTNGICVNQ